MNRTRPKQIVIRVSEEELAQIKEKVEQSGKSQQQYIIEALTQSNIVNLDGLKEIYPELKRQGNNLNQIAKKLNENGYVDYKQEYQQRFQDLNNQIEKLKLEYVNSLPFKKGDFVRVNNKGKYIEAYIEDVFMPIYDLSGNRFNLLVEDNENDEYCYVIAYIQIEDIEVIKRGKDNEQD